MSPTNPINPGDHHDGAVTRDMGAQAGGLEVAEGQDLEQPSRRQQDGGREQHPRQRQQHLVPAAGPEPAKDERIHLAQVVGVALLHVGLQGG